MFRCAKFAVVVWVRKTAALSALRNELIGLAADEPDESMEYEGVVDFHWSYDSLKEAERVAEAVAGLSQRSEIALVRMTSQDNRSCITFKDVRRVR